MRNYLEKAWSMKFRLMLMTMILIAIYAYYREFHNIFLAIMNGMGILGVSIIGALAWIEKDEL